jgi:phage terminase large subunit
MEVIKHVLSTPGGQTLMGAQTIPQLEQTSMKEFLETFPKPLIKNHNKAKMFVDVINGHRVLFRPLDDDGKIRSLNLSMAHIEEASEVDFSIFVQLQTRLRSHATKHHQLIMSSNPDIGWIRTEILLKSNKIHGAEEPYFIDPNVKNPSISTHIAATKLNKYLPPDFYDTTARGKPSWWVKRYLEGSFAYTDGQVYPQFAEHIIDSFDIISKIKAEGWQVYASADFGLRDPTVMLMAAVDPTTGIVYVFDEHYEAGKPVSHHSRIMNEMLSQVPPTLLNQPIGDPSGAQRSKNDLRSLFSHYAEYDLHFKPGMNRIEDGIQKVYTYLEHGQIKIFNTCTNTIREGVGYKYNLQELDSKKNLDEKPIDRENHAMDSLRYLIQELSDDPEQMKTVTVGPVKVEGNGRSLDHLPHALQDNEDDVYSQDWYYTY